jgi:hypothetical protein
MVRPLLSLVGHMYIITIGVTEVIYMSSCMHITQKPPLVTNLSGPRTRSLDFRSPLNPNQDLRTVYGSAMESFIPLVVIYHL